MTNLLNKEAMATIGNVEYKGIVTDYNNEYAWMSVVIDGHKDEYSVKLSEIKVVEKPQTEWDMIVEAFDDYAIDGSEDTIILEGNSYEIFVGVVEHNGETVYTMETVNLGRLATSKDNNPSEWAGDLVEKATGNFTTRKTAKGIISLVEKWLDK